MEHNNRRKLSRIQISPRKSFTPKNFHLIKKESSQLSVKKISNNIWYGTPSNLTLPKVDFYVKFPGLTSLENLLFFKLLHLQGNLKPYRIEGPAENQIIDAGNSFDLRDGSFKISAFSDSVAQILDSISPIETNCYQYDSSLLMHPEELFAFDYPLNPFEEAKDLLSEILINHRCTSADEIKKNISDRFRKFLKSPDEHQVKLDDVFANPEFFVYGNILPQDAIALVDKLMAKIPKSIESDVPIRNHLNISKHNLIYRANFRSLLQDEAVVLNYYQGAPVNVKNLYYQGILLSALKGFIQTCSASPIYKDIRITIQDFIKGDRIGFLISGRSFEDLHEQNKIDLVLEHTIDHFYNTSKVIFQEKEESLQEFVASSPKFLKEKFVYMSEEADEIFSCIDSQVSNYIRPEDSMEFFEDPAGMINAREYLEYLDSFFANTGKISLQGFSHNNFSNLSFIKEQCQLITKKRPVVINSTEELQTLFASQIKKNIIIE